MGVVTVVKESMASVIESKRLSERSYFVEQLRQHVQLARRNGQTLAVLIVNLRRMREINATFGHRTGDELLKELSERLRTAVRAVDILARTGDDEYSLILPKLKNKGLGILAINKILAALNPQHDINGHHIRSEVAIGMAIFPEHGDEMGLLLQNANLALCECRQSRASYEIYSDRFSQRTTSALLIQNGLEQAIQNDELSLYYQPKIHLATNRFAGAEALSRWHSGRGMVSPDVFIPVAEQTGFILPLTLWSLNVALRQCESCRSHLPDLSVSVNLSASILHHLDVVDLVDRAMNIWNIHAGQLILEVTESAMMQNPHRSIDTLHKLHERGIKISIDDFGTGYSSLAYLKELPVQELKIDKSFVINMAHDRGDEKIVRAIIDIAHTFNLEVTAEGVENRATMERLQQFECDYVQGFYIARPMPAEEIRAWLKVSEWGAASLPGAPNKLVL